MQRDGTGIGSLQTSSLKSQTASPRNGWPNQKGRVMWRNKSTTKDGNGDQVNRTRTESIASSVPLTRAQLSFSFCHTTSLDDSRISTMGGPVLALARRVSVAGAGYDENGMVILRAMKHDSLVRSFLRSRRVLVAALERCSTDTGLCAVCLSSFPEKPTGRTVKCFSAAPRTRRRANATTRS